jgi:hypothetical protein
MYTQKKTSDEMQAHFIRPESQPQTNLCNRY